MEDSIQNYIEEARDYDLSKYFREGFYLDVRDEFSWLVAYIKEVNSETGYIDIHFDNWAAKYDEVSREINNSIFC